MTVEFNENEIKVLINLIDIAVRNGGLNVAEAGVVLAKKLSDAMQPKEKTETE